MKNKITNVTGIQKYLFTQFIKISVFFYFLPDLLTGKISFSRYILFLKRLLYFLSKIYHNKFTKVGKNIRMGLYIPGFPSKAFFTACRKFMRFDEKLPCTTALVSVTSACRFHCRHCYQRNDLGKDIDIGFIIDAVKKMQNMGITFFNVEGGEPFLVYDRLKKLCSAIGPDAEIWINSTGDGMTLERLKELKNLGVTSIMFSLHSTEPERVNTFMQSDKAWDTMITGVQMCHQAGIPVSFNSCLMRESFYNGDFEKLLDKAKGLGACVIQIIKPKPSGGWLESGIENFTQKDLQKVKQLVHLYNNDSHHKDYPSISAQIIEEDPTVFGCTAGGTDRFYLNAKGDVQPCEFLNISYGNIAEEEFLDIYKRMRAGFESPGECWLCEKYASDILQLVRDNGIRTLPLNKNLSKSIYSNWDRGNPTKIYEKIEKGLR